MSTHLLEIRLDPAQLMTWARNIGIGHADVDYIVHSVLCASYGDERPRPFVQAPGGRDIRILGYAKSPAATLTSLRQATADPEIDGVFISEVSKTMPQDWTSGQRFSFELRAAPTRQRSGRKGEVDAADLRSENQTIEEAYLEWLTKRVEAGVRLDRVSITSMKKSKVRRRGVEEDGRRRLTNSFTIPDVTFKGQISVSDPVAFAHILGQGIGRHKAFGFGALLLRPPG